MAEEKKSLEQLRRNDLVKVKGGIPYEKPILLDLSGTDETCGVGRICSTGTSTSCDDGTSCSKGKGGPEEPVE
jgi:hypothetical protein